MSRGDAAAATRPFRGDEPYRRYLESVLAEAPFQMPGRAFAAAAPVHRVEWRRCGDAPVLAERAWVPLDVNGAKRFFEAGADDATTFLSEALGRRATSDEAARLGAMAAEALGRGVPVVPDDDDRDRECRGRFLTTYDYDFPADELPNRAWRGGAARFGWCLAFDGDSVAKYDAAPSSAPPDAATKRCFPRPRAAVAVLG